MTDRDEKPIGSETVADEAPISVDSSAELMESMRRVTQPSAELMELAASLGSSAGLMGEIAAATAPVARLLTAINQNPALTGLSDVNARWAEQMIRNSIRTPLLALSDLGQESLGEFSDSDLDRLSSGLEERGALLGLSPERYFAVLVATLFVLLWFYFSLSEMNRMDQGIEDLNRASLTMEWLSVGTAALTIYGASFRLASKIQGQDSAADSEDE